MMIMKMMMMMMIMMMMMMMMMMIKLVNIVTFQEYYRLKERLFGRMSALSDVEFDEIFR